MSKSAQNSKPNKPIFKKWWFWVVVVIAIGAIAVAAQGGDKADEDSKTASESKDKLTLDEGWEIDKSNQFATYVVGTVSNNTDKAINSYVQITFTALDADGANVGDCLANANTVDANGKWKFKAICSGDNIETVRFKNITGF